MNELVWGRGAARGCEINSKFAQLGRTPQHSNPHLLKHTLSQTHLAGVTTTPPHSNAV